MAVSLREYRAKIRSTQSTKKITRAMELIAASRIIKAQQQAASASSYAREITQAVSALATYAKVEHILTTEPTHAKRSGVLVISSDRGLAGAYASSVMKEAEQLVEKLNEEGKSVHYFLSGRKAESYFSFRSRSYEESWSGYSDKPTYEDAKRIGDRIIAAAAAYESPAEAIDAGKAVDELFIVFTRFKSMLVQEPTVIRLFPIEIVEGGERPKSDDVLPLYEFEPSSEEVLEALLPKYLYSRIFFCLLQAAASELAARQKAMKSATDNAEDLIQQYTRLANQARQAGITQEISEIVGGANALADAGQD